MSVNQGTYPAKGPPRRRLVVPASISVTSEDFDGKAKQKKMTTLVTEKTQSMDRGAALVVLPAARARLTPNALILSQKFINGMRKYVEYWDGPVVALMEPTGEATSMFDDVEVDTASLPFHVHVVSFDDPKLDELLTGCRLVLGSLSHRQNQLGMLCRSLGVPCIYVAEYSLEARLQVIRSEVRNPIISLRRQWWEYNQERRQRAGIRLSAGIQCNGTPTFEAYRSISRSPLLFFDTRMTEDMAITKEELAARTEALKRGDPLRLIFSGRLIRMKGADHLLQVALELRRLGGVPFSMTICGGGELETSIRADIQRLGLSDCVKLAGILDFKTELVSLTKRGTDLFICCHRTGDPSGTYLDVMLCGVPIVGYDNEAFRGIARESSVGWLVPINQPKLLAERIAKLGKDRMELLDASYQALEFGIRHTFERTFRARVEHMRLCSAKAEAHSP
jgi:colanic acid/amylovoran biosynthesis glycosyltransferase